jgi:hypothetical protein
MKNCCWKGAYPEGVEALDEPDEVDVLDGGVVYLSIRSEPLTLLFELSVHPRCVAPTFGIVQMHKFNGLIVKQAL